MSKFEEGVQVKQITVKIGGNLILNGISLTVHPGETVGIIGANGCGKTTLLRVLAGLIYPDKGEVFVKGRTIKPGFVGNIPSSLGIMIENPAFLPQFSGFRNLKMLADIRGKIGKDQVEDMMRKMGLDPGDRKPVRSYSLGMRQRLGIAQALMENPEVLLLDEPTNGLDESGVESFSIQLKEQTRRGAAVLLVSHQKDEIVRYCDGVYRLSEGTLIATKAV